MAYQSVNESRRMWKFLVFGFLTFGIYCIWFWWTMINDMNTACGYVEDTDEDRSPHFLIFLLLSFITLNIYQIFWYYKQGQRLRTVGKKYGLEIDDKGSTYLLWYLLGSFLFCLGPYIAFYILICNCNKVCRCYNLSIQNNQKEPGKGFDQGRVNPPFNGKDPFDPHTTFSIDSLTESVRSIGTIRFTKGSMAGAELELRDGESVLIGRDSSKCQMILPDIDISHRHCSIQYSVLYACYYVTDYSSLGTYMNGSNRLTKNEQTRCPIGTKLTLGSGSTELQLN